MDQTWKKIIWRQFGAALDMLENAIKACPESLWGKGNPAAHEAAFWYMAYHTLFFLGYYLHGSDVGYQPPAPFTLGELDPAGVLPDRVYTKDELLNYLEHSRRRARAVIGALTDAQVGRQCGFEDRGDITAVELLLYNMRHVQHHTAQLNMLLRQNIDSAPRWVSKTALALDRSDGIVRSL